MTEAQFKAQIDAQRLAAERAYELEQVRISGQTAAAVDWIQALSTAASVMFQTGK